MSESDLDLTSRSRRPAEENFGAVVIGSGLGGLSAAATLARVAGTKVLVLERHRVAGGYTHVFRRRGGYEWDVGLHYAGQLGPGGQIRAFSDYVSGGALEWRRMPDPFDTYIYPDQQFDAYGDRDTHISSLISRYPDEERAIRRYYRHIQWMERWTALKVLEGAVSQRLKPLVTQLKKLGQRRAEMTTKDYLDRNFADPGLKAILCSNYCAYGLPPSQSAFYYHSMVANHYLQGGFYPVGGAGALAESIIPVIESAGGEVRLQAEVIKILVEDGQAVGVEFRRGPGSEVERVLTSTVISDIGFCNTYGALLKEADTTDWADSKLPNPSLLDPSRYAKHLPQFGIMELFIGLKDSPARLGVGGQNVIILNSTDLEVTFDQSGMADGRPECGFLSFPSMKDPEAKAHTAQIFWFAKLDAMDEWNDTRWGKRGKDYVEMKDQVTEGFLALIERQYPGFGELVDHVELATPLSYEHFVGQPKGTPYGLAMTPGRLKDKSMGIAGPIKNLYFTGADTLMVGIAPAFALGALAAGVSLGPAGLTRVLTAVGRDAFANYRDRRSG